MNTVTSTKTIFLLIIASCFISIQSSAQIKWVQIGVDGLTCSACTRAVEMNLRKLDFVDSVSMSLENTEGRLFFKTDKKVNIEKIALAVTDAGFSVRYLKAAFVFKNLDIAKGSTWVYENEQYCFVKAGNKKLDNETVVVFLGNKFMPSKTYKQWKKEIIECCGPLKKNTFYITQ